MKKKEDSENKKVFVFVGDKGSGKTNLITKLLDLKMDIKSTVALDFMFGNKKRDDDKVRVNTYELGGGRVLSNMLKAPLSMYNIHQVETICIVLDLSKPGNCIDSLLYWIEVARKYSNAALQDLQNQKIDVFRKVHQRTTQYWQNAPCQQDRSQMKISMTHMTVIGAKYDLFA